MVKEKRRKKILCLTGDQVEGFSKREGNDDGVSR